MPGHDIHVVPADDRWAVETEGSPARETFDTQEEAVAAGTERAKQKKSSSSFTAGTARSGSATASATTHATSRVDTMPGRPAAATLNLASFPLMLAKRGVMPHGDDWHYELKFKYVLRPVAFPRPIHRVVAVAFDDQRCCDWGAR